MNSLKFNHRKFRPSRSHPYDRRKYKLTKSEPQVGLQLVTLYTPYRKQLLALIRANPGVSYHALARMTGRCDARVHDNVRHLVKARLVHVVKEPGRSYLYANGVKHASQKRATLLGEGMRRVYEYMLQHPEATRQQVIRELGLTRHQAYRAMNAPEERGIIRQMRRVTIARLVRPAREEELEFLVAGVRRRA